MSAEALRRRAAFLAEYRWGLAFGIAIALSALTVGLRGRDAPLIYDVIPVVALGAVWLAAGLGLGAVGRRWERRASDAALPVARVERG